MSTFFSDTDTATLKEEGIDRNHFVSLIVNNEGTYTAAITRRLKSKKVINEQFSYPTFEDNEVTDDRSYETENEELQWFYLKIEFEKTEESFYDELNSRLEEIKKAKADKVAKNPIYNGGYGNYPNSRYQQGTLFPVSQDIETINSKKVTQSFVGQAGPANLIKKEKDTPIDYDFVDGKLSGKIPYGNLRFDRETIKSLTLQLITGSIIIPNSSKIDANKWAQGMTTLYENRFGEGEPGIKLFKVWADSYVEFLCWYSEDEKLIEQGLQDEELMAICAHDLIEELTKLPSNKYIKIYIDILEGYLI